MATQTTESTQSEKKFQDEIKDSVHKVWLAGLGAVAVAEKEGSKFLKNLVNEGEAWESRGKERFDEVKGKVDEAADKAKERAESTWDKVSEKLDDAVANTLRRMGVPSREEIATLTQRVEELTKVVEQLRDSKAPPKKAAAN